MEYGEYDSVSFFSSRSKDSGISHGFIGETAETKMPRFETCEEGWYVIFTEGYINHGYARKTNEIKPRRVLLVEKGIMQVIKEHAPDPEKTYIRQYDDDGNEIPWI